MLSSFKRFKPSITLATLFVYLSFGFLSFIHLIDMANMNMSMKDCPFTQNEKYSCLTETSVYIRSFLETIPECLSQGIFFVILFAFCIYYFQSLNIKRLILYSKRNRLKKFLLFQNLLSNGKLNTKVF